MKTDKDVFKMLDYEFLWNIFVTDDFEAQIPYVYSEEVTMALIVNPDSFLEFYQLMQSSYYYGRELAND